MNSRHDLRFDWCSHQAAKYACEKWHYSRCIPKSKLVRVGVWESGAFAGCIIFGSGACPQIAEPYGLKQTQVAELVRVALKPQHLTPTTKCVAFAIKMVRNQQPRLRLIVSYADPEQGHHGGIYQGGNWIYSGLTAPTEWFEVCKTGERIHSHVYRRGAPGRATRDKACGIIRSVKLVKHKYLMPLDDDMRKRIEPLRTPYPKRVTSADSGTPGIQPGGGGASPTVTLSIPASTPNGKTRTTARADNTEDSQRQPRKAAAKQARAKARK